MKFEFLRFDREDFCSNLLMKKKEEEKNRF
jgi:hypothetical protein